jgi:uncharacterized small protein (DUF1192 family)
MITKANALHSLRPGAQWVLRGDELEWLDTEQTQPTDAEIAAEITRLEADYAAKKYQRDRAKAYPSLAEQMDMQYWDSINGTTVWADTIAAIKAQFPKP